MRPKDKAGTILHSSRNTLESISRVSRRMLLPGILLISMSAACSKPLPVGLESEASMSTLVWLDDQYGIMRSRDLSRLLNRMSRRLGAVAYGAALETEVDASVARKYIDYPWQIFVMRSEQPNAFSPGAGVIVLTSGMLRATRTEAQLAAVVSHEMAHQILGHTREALREAHASKQQKPQYSYNLKEEVDADTLGLKIMHVARYDLVHALQALSIGYNPKHGHTAGIPEEWLSIRMSNLHQSIDGYGNYLPATQTTREFTRVRKHLGS